MATTSVLLPTYGTFTGQGEHAPPPTGGRRNYGMVNIVRLENGMLAEMWFGMDSLAESIPRQCRARRATMV